MKNRKEKLFVLLILAIVLATPVAHASEHTIFDQVGDMFSSLISSILAPAQDQITTGHVVQSDKKSSETEVIESLVLTKIKSCQVIDAPGYYVLDADISNSGNCVSIRSSNVVFDGKDAEDKKFHKITVSSGVSIQVNARSSDKIQNITIANVITNGDFIEHGETNKILIENSTFKSLRIDGSDDVIIINNTIGQDPFTGKVVGKGYVFQIYDNDKGVRINGYNTCIGSGLARDSPLRTVVINNTIIGTSNGNAKMVEFRGTTCPRDLPYPSTNAYIFNNTIINTDACTSGCEDPTAFRLGWSRSNTIKNNTIISTGTASGMYFRDTEANIVEDNYVKSANLPKGLPALVIGPGNNFLLPNSFTFRRNILIGVKASAIKGTPANSSFENNVLWSNSPLGSEIYIGGTGGSTFTHNTFYNSYDDPKNISYVVTIDDPTSGTKNVATFNNNIFARPNIDRILNCDGAIISAHNYDGDNNIFYSTAGSSASLFCGNTFSAWKTATVSDSKSMFANPQFTDPLKGNFQPKDVSAACNITGGYAGAYTCGSIPSTVVTCTDTDNGINYDTQGKVIININSVNYTDTCNNSTSVKEYYCSSPNSSTVSSTTYTCPNGCSSGRCVQLPLPEINNTDDTPPEVSITNSPQSPQTGQAVVLTAIASDNVNILNIIINLDGSNVKTCTSSPCTYSTIYSAAGSHTYYATTKDTSNNTDRDPVSGTKTFSVSSLTQQDTSPPARLTGQPSGTLPSGTTSATLSLTTNESATCKYSTVANTAYDSMTSNFTITGGTSHSKSLNSLSAGSYNYYVKCKDVAGNTNTNDYSISFSIASAPVVVSGAKNLTNCQTISTSGYYVLISDVTSSGTCFPITASNVVIDGKDSKTGIKHKINSGGNAFHIGQNFVTISNITIKNLDSSGSVGSEYYARASKISIEDSSLGGVTLWGVDDMLIKNNKLSGIGIEGTEECPSNTALNAKIINNTITGNRDSIFTIKGNGCDPTLVATYHVIENNTIINNWPYLADCGAPGTCTSGGGSKTFYVRGYGTNNIIKNNKIISKTATAFFMRDGANNNVISNNYFEVDDSDRSALFFSSGSEHVSVSGNKFINNTFKGLRTKGISTQGWGSNNIFEDNVFWGNTASGGYGGYGANFVTAGGGGNTFIHNTFYNSYTDGPALKLEVGAAPTTFNRNIFVNDNTADVFSCAGSISGYSGNNNIMDSGASSIKLCGYSLDGWKGATGDDSNSQHSDPLFVNADSGDFHLQSGSLACIVGGSYAGAYPCGSILLGETCGDTDSGIDYNVQGTVVANGLSYTDSCATSNQLTEYSCSSSSALVPTTTLYTCPNGCTNGRCSTQTTDTVAPSVSVSHSPSSPTIGETLIITATATDNVGLSSIIVNVDGTIVKTCNSSPCIYSATYTNSGSHTYYATALDTYDNIGRDPSSGTRSFTVTSSQPTSTASCGSACNNCGTHPTTYDSGPCSYHMEVGSPTVCNAPSYASCQCDGTNLVNNIRITPAVALPGQAVTVEIDYGCYSSAENLALWYYSNGTWQVKKYWGPGQEPLTGCDTTINDRDDTDGTKTFTFTPDLRTGIHYIRAIESDSSAPSNTGNACPNIAWGNIDEMSFSVQNTIQSGLFDSIVNKVVSSVNTIVKKVA